MLHSTTDVGTNTFAHLSMKALVYALNLKLQVRATQSLKLCYASCHAKLFDKAKARHQNRLDSVARSVKKSAIKPKIKHLGVAQLGARYLGVVEAASSSLVTQTS